MNVSVPERWGGAEGMEEQEMKRLRLSAVIFVALFWFVAMTGSVGATSDGYKEISAPEVKSLVEKQKAVVVNLLSKIEFETQHIPNSINIPIVDMETTGDLPKDKDAPLVLYCMGKR